MIINVKDFFKTMLLRNSVILVNSFYLFLKQNMNIYFGLSVTSPKIKSNYFKTEPN